MVLLWNGRDPAQGLGPANEQKYCNTSNKAAKTQREVVM